MVILLLACATSHWPGCDKEITTVTDEEALPDLDLTVSEIFAEISGPRVVPAQFLDGEGGVAAVRVETSRGEGDATWTVATPTDEKSYHFGIGEDYPLINVICDSGLDVPARIEAAREDGTGAFAGEHGMSLTVAQLEAGEVGASGKGTGTGDWASYGSAFTGYENGTLTSLQLQGDGDVLIDWR